MVYEVGYNVGNSITSVNMLEGDTASVMAEAEKHEKRFGYTLSYIVPIDDCIASSNKAKGMPYKNVGYRY